MRYVLAALGVSSIVSIAPLLAQSITMTSPTGSERVASGRDFATDVIGDPWDLDKKSDVSPYVLDFSSWSVAGGVFSGVTTTTPNRAPVIYVQYMGEAGTNHHGREGVFYPIDASLYRRVSLRMYTDQPGIMRFQYLRQPGWLTDTTSSNFVTLQTGWNVYDVDLAALGGQCAGGSNCSSPTWAGTILGFGIEPSRSLGATVIIDWIRLRAGDTGATTFSVNWSYTDPTGSAIVDLYADDDTNAANGFIHHFATGLPASAGSFAWPVNAMAPGSYYVYGVIGTSYAGTALRDEWDMSQTSDLSWTGFEPGAIAGGRFSGVSTGGAAALFPRVPLYEPVKAAAFHHFLARMDVSANTYYRVVWKRKGASNYSASEFFPATVGMKDYQLDLAQYPEWSGEIEVFRVNPVFAAGITVNVDSLALSSTASSGPTGSDYSDGPLRINEVPQVTVTDPDLSGGEDFATAVLGNPWDMNDAADVAATTNLTNLSFTGGQLHATSTSNDPAIYFYQNGGPAIDAAKYHLFTVAFQVDAPFDVPLGSVARVFWRPDVLPSTPQSVTQDYLAYPDYVVLTTDLSQVLLENNPPYNLPIPWGATGTEAELRFDATELPASVNLHLDFAKLATEDASDGQFTIRWNDTDSDSGALIDLYWDSDNSGFDGTRIVQGIAEDDPANSYVWSSGAAPQGPLWIYATISDGYDTVSRYATGMLINNATDGLPPYLTLLSPDRNATGVSPNAAIVGHVRDVTSGVNTGSVAMRVNGSAVAATVSGNSGGAIVSYRPPTPWSFGQTVAVQVDADDLAGNHLQDSYSFTVTTSGDSDGDLMPDQFEVSSSTDPLSAAGLEGGAGDPDEDGGSSLGEYQAGSDPTSWAQIVVGPGPGGGNPPLVAIHYYEGTPVGSFSQTAYGVNKYGVNVGVGDVESPTSRTILTGPGPGDVFGPQVKAFRPDNTTVGKVNFYAYGTLKYGVHAQAGDVDGDGFAELLTAPGRGAVFGPHVRGWNFDGGTVTNIAKINFFAYGTLKYGAHVTGGEMEGDGYDELVTAPGPGVVFGPQVRGFDYDGGSIATMPKINFFAVPTTQYGAEIATGEVDRDAFDELLASPGPGPSFGALLAGWNYDGTSVSAIAAVNTQAFTTLYGMVPAAGDLDGDRIDEIVCGVGPDPAGGSAVRAYDYAGGTLSSMSGSPFDAFPGYAYGVRVAAGRLGF